MVNVKPDFVFHDSGLQVCSPEEFLETLK